MKNVTFMINSLGKGGAEKALIQILNSLDKSKYKLKLIVFKNDGGYMEDVPEEVEVITLLNTTNNLVGRIRWSVLWRIMRYFPKVIKKIIISKINIEDDTLISFLEGPSSKITSMFPNKKISWMHTDYMLNRWPKDYYKSVASELDAYNRFNDIIFVSENGQKSFNEFFEDKVTVKEKIIYNPINTRKIISDSLLEDSDVKDWVDQNKNTIKVISVGRLTDVKRLDWLIRAQKQFNLENISVSTTIIGEGKLYEEFGKVIKKENIKGIHLIGFKKNPFPYLKHANIYTSTSITESYPLSIAEAYTLDIPVIATTNSGSKELSSDGEFAMLVDSDYDSFFNALKKMIMDPKLINKYRDKSIIAKKQFNLDAVISEIEDLLDNVESHE
ncbi:glycosyltransferase [Dellaglioa carnosa]|uniref:glycosyltransferase n=1 Tax=Dellaglioa carnosa TaxID=2995136 RepID=UPI0022A82657|nr:glycosyltransferase [Dellaglioa carnosa]MCZ2492141.1 glycosyltransferase [Dellaglioa carnosa]